MNTITILKQTFGSITILEFYFCLTFVFTCLSYKYKIRHFRQIAAISFLNVTNILLSHFLLTLKIPIALNSSVYIIIHHFLWLLILFDQVQCATIYKKTLLLLFLIWAVFNLCFFEGFFKFNTYTFITGAFIYLVIFISESFRQLQKENLGFFQSNSYLLLCSPLLFFTGLSFMFGFKSKAVTSVEIFNSIKLYSFISYFVNTIYYTLLNLYIYKERQLKND